MKKPSASPIADLNLPLPHLIPATSEGPENQSLKQLRRSETFACLSAWLGLFGEEFGLMDYEPALLEQDLDGRFPDTYAPVIAWRLLQGMTVKERTVQLNNFMPKLRREWMKRNPSDLLERDSPKAKDDSEVEYKEWNEFNMFEKVFILYTITQWHFQDTHRFRALLGPVSDEVDWRIEPVGKNAEGDAYWLFDDNRLWKQTQKIEPTSDQLKRKGASNGNQGQKNKKRQKLDGSHLKSKAPAHNQKSNLPSLEKGDVMEMAGQDSTLPPTPASSWQAVCVHLDDWERLLATLKTSKHSDEKALYRHFTRNVVPAIREDFENKQRLLEKQARAQKKAEKLSQGMMQRKRSSRIADKENEMAESKRAQAAQDDFLDSVTGSRRGRSRQTTAEPSKLPEDRESRMSRRQQQRELEEMTAAAHSTETQSEVSTDAQEGL